MRILEIQGRCYTCRKTILLLYAIEPAPGGASWRFRLLNHYPAHETCADQFRDRQRELAGFEARPLIRFNAIENARRA